MSHLAITDHGTLSGHRNFQKAAADVGVTPILGLEGYISATDRFDKRDKKKREDGTSVYNHITLIAQNETGLRSLKRISEVAWTEGYYYKPRMDTDLLFENTEGLVVLSGCMSGLIAKAHLTGDDFTARQYAKQYKDALGDNFYIEVMSSNEPELNHFLLGIADEFNIKPVMTTDCHYARKEDLWIEEAMLIIATNPNFDKTAELGKAAKMEMLDRLDYLYPGRQMRFTDIEIYLRDYETEVEKFAKQDIIRTDIFENTLEIAGGVEAYEYNQNLDLLPPIDKQNPDQSLESKVWHGLRQKGLAEKPEYIERAKHELSVIKEKNFSVYFLIVEDMIKWAEGQNILVGPGRGSSAGSLVCYALGIIKIDPLVYNCLFERFLDPDRSDWPDIDVDFEDKRRGEVKEYLISKYPHVASIATFNTFGGKSAIKDAAKVLRVPLAETNKATKNNDVPQNDDDEDEIDYFDHFTTTDQSKGYAKKYPEVITLARRLYGKYRSMGMHASGVVLSKNPIEWYGPKETSADPHDKTGPRVPYIGMNMHECADIGLIKMDLLGLKALSVIKDTIQSIQKRHNKVIDPWIIPLDNKDVFDMLSSGYTKGVFQMEQPAYTRLIFDMGGVRNFGEMVASNALVRPGAKNTIGAEYIARKSGKKAVTYIHPKVKDFTEDTYGMVTLFQEQVMLVTQVLGGLTAAESNELRRGLGKKDVAYIKPFESKFKENAVQYISKKDADKMWKDIEAGAGYSFNIAHSVVYSLVGYVTAWLKLNYTVEFMAATIANEKDKDSITDYLLEAKRLGVKVLLPHINESNIKTEVQGDAVRLGLTNIKFVGDKVAAAVVRERPFANYAELEVSVSAKNGNGLNARMLGAMNKVGAAAFDDNPRRGDERDYFYEYLQIPAFEVKDLDPQVKYRLRDIEDYDEDDTFAILAKVRKITKKDGWCRIDVIDETGSTGIFAPPDIPMETGQMYAILVSSNRIARYLTMDELHGGVSTEFSRWLHGELPPPEEEGYYRVVSFRTRMTKANKKMADIVLQDHLGHLSSAMVWPDTPRSRMYTKAFSKCVSSRSMKFELGETETGGIYVKDITG